MSAKFSGDITYYCVIADSNVCTQWVCCEWVTCNLWLSWGNL